MATKLSGPIQVHGGPLFTSGGDSAPIHDIGSLGVSNDGRKFRYVFCTPTALVAGKLQQGPAEVTNHQDLTSPVAAVGDTTIAVTLGNTLAQANQYAGGLAIITVTPGVGYSYRIKSHPAAAASASLTLTLDDPIEVALNATSRIDLVQNPFNGVIVYPTTATGGAVGVAVDVVDAGKYGWIQSGGAVGCLANGAVAIGDSVCASNAVAGSVESFTTGSKQNIVGYALTGVADTEYGAIYLTID
ncbi:MAG: hypothetical protein NUV85_03835 [Candidatus Berkelbacteria bacterium]|nr:hypothetical protein [Candidatus Berkelbacteria bacterium]